MIGTSITRTTLNDGRELKSGLLKFGILKIYPKVMQLYVPNINFRMFFLSGFAVQQITFNSTDVYAEDFLGKYRTKTS